tara:strand:- start:2325 stop:3041 length:717 start_codon:yes stop_codon:yes gene_type:complete
VSTLTNRALLLDEFFRLVNADITDDDMIEHDPSDGDGAYQLLQAGCWDAQLYLIDCGVGSRWAKTTSALTFTGTDPDKYVALPADFLRLESDHRRSGLRTTAGISWGREIPFRNRFDHFGNCFYMRGNEATSGSEGELRLYVVRGSAPLTGMVADYFYKHATLADATTVDFPEEDRQLIVAFAALRASFQSWFSGGMEGRQLLQQNLDFMKQQAWRRSRFSRQPKMVQPHAMVGDRWY